MLFSAFHVDLYAFVPLLGWLLAYVYERTQSLWTPVMLHVCNNALSLGAVLALRCLP